MTIAKHTTGTATPAPVFSELESWVRMRVQQFVQQILEEEVTSLVGREKSQRREEIDAPAVYRNGYGKTRRLSMTGGTIELRRPRVRGLEERFESRVLPLFVRRTSQVSDLLPELYLHGLSQGDFELALRGLLGEGAPLSASSIARLKEKWQAEYEAWRTRDLSGLEVVYLWVDGVYVKAGLEKEKACLLVALAGLSDGTKVFVALECGYRESTESWGALLRGLRDRGLNAPKLVVGDGHLGIWSALAQVWPESDTQRCWNHKLMNVLDRVPKKKRAHARMLLKAIPASETRRAAETAREKFAAWCRKNGFERASEILAQDWERMMAFYAYPKAHWMHLRTSNTIESPFAFVRLRTDASKRYKKAENATAIIWKTMMVAERTFRRLRAPELLSVVAVGAQFADGEKINRTVATRGAAA